MTSDAAAPLIPPPPPPAKSGSLKWILIGCGCAMFAGIAVFAGCGILAWKAVRSTMDEVARPGGEYLASRPEFTSAFGTLGDVEPMLVGSTVQTDNGKGWARMRYSFACPKGPGSGSVWLKQVQGTWTCIGARARVGSDVVTSGMPPTADGSD